MFRQKEKKRNPYIVIIFLKNPGWVLSFRLARSMTFGGGLRFNCVFHANRLTISEMEGWQALLFFFSFFQYGPSIVRPLASLYLVSDVGNGWCDRFQGFSASSFPTRNRTKNQNKPNVLKENNILFLFLYQLISFSSFGNQSLLIYYIFFVSSFLFILNFFLIYSTN